MRVIHRGRPLVTQSVAHSHPRWAANLELLSAVRREVRHDVLHHDASVLDRQAQPNPSLRDRLLLKGVVGYEITEVFFL